MFCTSLRRRLSFASVIPMLVGSENLGLRESQLITHDLALPIAVSVDPRTGSAATTRQLRILLLSPSATKEDNLSGSVERISRFAALTGGHDLAIVFLLDSVKDTPGVLARDSKDGVTDHASGEHGVLAYSRLQATMMDHAEIPRLPILLLEKLDSLPHLLKKHVAQLGRPRQKAKLTTNPFALLQLCTANSPMSQRTAYFLSDLFPNLRDLAAACTSGSSAPNSSSPSARAAGFSSQMLSTQASGVEIGPQHSDDHALGKLKQLRDLVGEQECADIVDFWKDEWVIN